MSIFPRSGADEPQSETPKVPAVNVRQPGEGLALSPQQKADLLGDWRERTGGRVVNDGAEPLALSSGDNTQADNNLPDRRAFLRRGSLLVAGLVGAPYVRRFWPGWSAPSDRAFVGVAERELRRFSTTTIADLNRLLREVYTPALMSAMVSDSDLLGLFHEAESRAEGGRYIEINAPYRASVAPVSLVKRGVVSGPVRLLTPPCRH